MIFDTQRQRAGLLLFLLGSALLLGLLPFAAGLVGVPVFYVLLQPVHGWLGRHVGPRTAALLVVVLALLLVVVPAFVFLGLVVTQAQSMAGNVAEGSLLARLDRLNIMGIAIGPTLAEGGSALLKAVGSSALGLIGTVTRQALNLTIALFGLYYLLLKPDEAWRAFSGYLPFGEETLEQLRDRFRKVTTSLVVGEGLTAGLQGALMGVALWAAGFPNAPFWAMVTVALAILPVVGSGLVWVVAAVILAAVQDRPAAAAGMVAWGILVVANVDIVVRPLVFKRLAHIHPMTTLVGALLAMPYFGILGLLIGPLALSYFFVLMAVYQKEYASTA